LQPEADQEEEEEEEEEEGTPCSKQNPHVGTLYYLSLQATAAHDFSGGGRGERVREVGSTGLLILSRTCESSAKVYSEKEPIMTEGEEESRAAAGSRLLLLLAELLLPLVLQL
jgi:hypothetical protein